MRRLDRIGAKHGKFRSPKFAYEPKVWIEATTPGTASLPASPSVAAFITRRSVSYAVRARVPSSERSRSKSGRSAFGIVNAAWRCATGATIHLYLFLVCVADKNGLSFYGDRRVAATLHVPVPALDDVRLMGGATTLRPYLTAGLIDESHLVVVCMRIRIAPLTTPAASEDQFRRPRRRLKLSRRPVSRRARMVLSPAPAQIGRAHV